MKRIRPIAIAAFLGCFAILYSMEPDLSIQTRRQQRLSPTEKWQIMKSIVIIDSMSEHINWDRIRENYRDYARIRNIEHRTRVRRRRLMQTTEEPSQSPTMNESGAPFLIEIRQGDADDNATVDDDAAAGLDDDLFNVTDDVPSDDVPSTDDDGIGVDDDVSIDEEPPQAPDDNVTLTEDDAVGVDDDLPLDLEPSSAPTGDNSTTSDDDAVGVDDDLPVDSEPSQAPTSDNGTVTDDDAVGVDDDLPVGMEPSQAPSANMTDDDAVGVDDDLPPEMEPSIAPSESLQPTTTMEPSQGLTEDDDTVGVDDDFPPDAEPSFAPSESAAPSESSVPTLSATPTTVSMEDDDAIGVDDDLPPDMIPSVAPSEAPSDLEPTSQPTDEPTGEPTDEPTLAGTDEPTSSPTQEPTRATPIPSREPTPPPTREATPSPTPELTPAPTISPTPKPTPANGGVVIIPVYEYNRGNCPNEGSTGLPCAPTNIGRVCSKYDDSGRFSECLRICEPSFCCVHDSPADTNGVAASCSRDENCAQYAPCYIVWWKVVDTVGPAAYLRLQQNDDFFDVDKLQDVTTDRAFYAQWAYHHWDDIDELLYDLLDPAESIESVFANPNIWNPPGT
jgi:hypothetical protein